MYLSKLKVSIKWNYMSVLLLFLLPFLSGGVSAARSNNHSEADQAKTNIEHRADQLVKMAEEQFSRFDANQYWDSVKTTTGIAKAVVIIPKSHQIGFVLGAHSGRGILLTRKEHKWSPPVFVKFNSLMFGLLAGVQKVDGIGVILSDDVINQISSKPFRIGGTADLTIAKGVSGQVVGGKEGISALMVSENKGLFIGGSVDAVTIRLDKTLNAVTYGPSVSIEDILSHKVYPEHPQSLPLRNMLETSAFNAVFEQ